jgi:uncharacterized protein YndB with AHSA1/START domain
MLHIRRLIPAAPEFVFRMMTEPELLAAWWGPRGFSVPSVELDARVGGTYRITMQPPEGDAFFLLGEFREIDPANRLVYTFQWDPPAADDRETVVTVSMRDVGGSTEVVVDQGPFATEERRALHNEGWGDTLDRLAEQAATQAG